MRPSPPTSPNSTTWAEPRQALRRRWPRRASGPASPMSPPGRGTHRPGPRRLPADRLRPQPRADAGVRGGRPGRRPRHLPSPSPARPRRRVRPGRPRARPPRRRDRGAPLHGLDAEERGERPPLGRRRRRGRWRRGAGHRPPRQDQPGGRGEGYAVREEGRRRPRPPDATGRRGPGAGRPSRAALATDGGAAVCGGSPSRRRRGAGDRPLWTGGAGVGVDEPGRVDHRRHARRHWKTSRMVAHYSAGATAERWAVARYL